MANRKQTGDADVIKNPDGSETLWNGTTVWYSLEIGDTTYNKGDAIAIDGIQGPTTFWSHQTSSSGSHSVTIWWVGRHFRDVPVDRIVGRQEARTASVGVREAKRQLIWDYVNGNPGDIVSIHTLVQISGMSHPTVSKFVKEHDAYFRPVKRGHYEIVSI